MRNLKYHYSIRRVWQYTLWVWDLVHDHTDIMPVDDNLSMSRGRFYRSTTWEKEVSWTRGVIMSNNILLDLEVGSNEVLSVLLEFGVRYLRRSGNGTRTDSPLCSGMPLTRNFKWLLSCAHESHGIRAPSIISPDVAWYMSEPIDLRRVWIRNSDWFSMCSRKMECIHV